MLIEKIDRKNGFITLEMSDKELRTITNLLCKSRKHIDFSQEDYAVNAELFTAISILHCGRLPSFELKKINELFNKATTITQQRSDNNAE